MTHYNRQSAFDPALPEDAFWVLQVTDMHLYDDPRETLLGVNTQDSFKQVLRDAINNKQRKPDLIVLTGDLVHDNSEAAYRRLGGILSDTGIPAYCLPGNHDDLESMAVLAEFPGVFVKGTVDIDGWRLVLLNSRVPNQEHGHLSEKELKRLAQRLNSKDNILICLHHQPVPVGSKWIDTMMLDNSESFLELVDSCPTVRCVIWGHIHQTFSVSLNDVQFLASPSTCIQFSPQREDFMVDAAPPACRMLALAKDGSVFSQVLALDVPATGLKMQSKGY